MLTGPHAEDVAIAASAYGIPTYVGDLRDAETGAGTTRRVSKVVLSVEQLHIDGQMSPVMTREAPVPFPLHHHAEVVHGNGTIGLQLEQEMALAASQGPDLLGGNAPQFDAIIADIGNGCTLSGVCMAFLGKSTQVFGAAPSSGFWEHAASLRQTETPIPQQSKSEYWKDLEIPIGDVPWSVFTSSGGLSGVFDVNDEAMAAASLKVFERSGLHLHPDEVVPLAVALYNQEFRQIIARKLRHGRGLTIGVVLQPRKSTLTGHVSQLGAEAMAPGSFQQFEATV
jgi:threonine dehydratase